MFGPNAVLDVSGSFHISTADYLRLADGGVFHVNPQNASVLTVASPAAFGFVNPMPASVTIDQTVLAVPQGKTLSVIGGDVQLVGGILRAANGLIQIASAASAGEVIPSAPAQSLDLAVGSFARLGQIQLSAGANATTSSAAGAGTVLIRGGRLIVDNAFLNANSQGAGNGAPVGIDVRITDDAILTNGAEILHFSFAAGRAGDARITAGKLQVKNGSFISGGTNFTGNPGNLAINVGTLEVLDGGSIIARTDGPTKGGNLDVTAGNVVLSGANAFGNTGLFAGQFNAFGGGFGSGQGGNLSVNAGRITTSGSNNPNVATGIFASTFGPGGSGALRVTAQGLDMTGNTSISNATFGPGAAGTVAVNVDGNISIIGSKNPNIFTGIFANTFGTGRAERCKSPRRACRWSITPASRQQPSRRETRGAQQCKAAASK